MRHLVAIKFTFFSSVHSSSSGGASGSSMVMYGSPGIWARIHTIYYRPVTSATVNSNTDSSAAGSHSCAQGKKIIRGILLHSGLVRLFHSGLVLLLLSGLVRRRKVFTISRKFTIVRG